MRDSVAVKRLSLALGKIPSGLFILSIRHDSNETGMLVSWVQQCSFQPPLITLAVQNRRDILTWLSTNAYFALSILDKSQTDMIAHFGRGFGLTEQAFLGLEVERAEHGSPVLMKALGYIECSVVEQRPTGDHCLILGRVVAGRLRNDGEPMVHIRKNGLRY